MSLQVLVQATGPEEMKFPQKALYTYNVRDGDSFILDEKAPPLPKLRATNSNRMSAAYSPNPQLSMTSPAYPQNDRNAVTFAVIDRKKLAAKTQLYYCDQVIVWLYDSFCAYNSTLFV